MERFSVVKKRTMCNILYMRKTYLGKILRIQIWCVARFGKTTLLKVTSLHGCFSRFLSCTNDTKSRKAWLMIIYFAHFYSLTVIGLKRILTKFTAQKMKFSIKTFFSKCDQTHRKLRICPHLLNNSSMQNFIFCAVVLTNIVDKLTFWQDSEPIFLVFIELQENRQAHLKSSWTCQVFKPL